MFHIYVAIAMGLIALYVIVRLVVPFPLHPAVKVVLSLLLLTAVQKMLLLRLFMGPTNVTFSHGMGTLILAASFFQAIVICLFLVTLLRDIVWLVFRLVGFLHPMHGPIAHLRYFFRPGILCGMALFLAGYGTWEAVRVPDVHEVRLRVPGLSPELNGFRIVQLSDLHIGPIVEKDWVSAVVERTNALQPDLVAITGDVIDGYPASVRSDVAPLADLAAPCGVYLVPGNHEYYSGVETWLPVFRELGLRVLLNDWEPLRIRDTEEEMPLVVAGITDPAAFRFRREALSPDIPPRISAAFSPPEPERVLKDICEHRPDTPMPVTLMLAHSPKLAVHSARAGATIQLSGHTHGGQIAGFSPLVAHLNAGFVRGAYNVHGMPLYVSPGAGLWAGLPLRLGVSPEIALIILEAEDRE